MPQQRAAGCSGVARLGNGQLGSLLHDMDSCRWCLDSTTTATGRHTEPPRQPVEEAVEVVPCFRHSSGAPAEDNIGFSLYFKLMWKWSGSLTSLVLPATSETTQSFEIHYIFRRRTGLLAVIIYSI